MKTAGELTCARGAVAANPSPAETIGAAMFEAGGNAADAAVAASLACCMLQPNSVGVGGYGCAAVVRDGRTGTVWSVDANGIAPRASHASMFEVLPVGDGSDGFSINESEYDCSVRDHANVNGPLSVTVPGMMAGMGIIHERWGKLPWRTIVEPSLKLLADGFAYSVVADWIGRRMAAIEACPATAAHLMPDGRLPQRGDIWHRPDMEKTLERLAAAGWRDFYSGQIGRQIADYLCDAGGIMSRADMAAYEPRLTEPHTIHYRDAVLSTAVLPNGGFTTLQALAMIGHLDLPADDSPLYYHLLAEVLKLAWRDRLEHAADPAFAPVPIATLLSAAYTAERVAPIRRAPQQVDQGTGDAGAGSAQGTLHVSSADSSGNLVSMTITQGDPFGSCVTVPGTGIILGHGMCRFDPRPGRNNSIAPGKRPLNNMSPLMVEMPERTIAIGVPGGRKILAAMTLATQLLVERNASARHAATAPRLHVEAYEPLEIQQSVPTQTVEALRAMGHRVKTLEALVGVTNAAEFYPGSGQVRAASGATVAGV